MAPPGSSAPAQTETYRRRHLSGSISSMPPQGPCLAGLPFWPTQPFRALLPDSFRPGAHAGPKFGRIHYLASRPIVRGPTSVSPSKAPTVEPRSNITGRCICNETGVIFFELPNVVEDSNLPVHLPTQCSDPIGARGPLAPASSLSISRAFYDPQQGKLPWKHAESASYVFLCALE